MEMHPTAVKEETGFSVLEMLLSLIIVGLLAFIGLYVYQTQKNASATYSAASKAAQANAPKAVKKAPAVATTQPTYLTIKEWGVRMKLPEAIKDANYGFRSDSPSTKDTFAGLSTVSLTKLSAACGPTATTVGALVRQTTEIHESNVAAQAKNGVSFDNEVYSHKLGNYYYAFIHAQAACFDSESSPAGVYYTTVKPDTLLRQAVDTLELAQ